MVNEVETRQKIINLYKKFNYPSPEIIFVPSPQYLTNYGLLLKLQNASEMKYLSNKKHRIQINYAENILREIKQHLSLHSDVVLSAGENAVNKVTERMRMLNNLTSVYMRSCTFNNHIARRIINSMFKYNIRYESLEGEMFPINYIGIWDNLILIPYTDRCIVTEPIFIKYNSRGLHNVTDYALYYKDDPYDVHDGYYYVNGVYFDDKLFTKFFINKSYTSEDILILENTEQKSAIINEIGYTNLMKNIKEYSILDEVNSVCKLDNKPIIYQVIEFTMPAVNRWQQITLRMVRVEDHSTHKIVFLGVPQTDTTKTCKGAIGWTFGIDTNGYNPDIET